MAFRESWFHTVFWKRFRHNRFAMAGGCVVLLLFVVSLLAPYITPWDPHAIDAYHVLLPPSANHWFGTDELGRDVFTRVVYGARISLKVGFVSVGIAVAIGVVLGLVSGFYGGIIDTVIMRFVDIMLCFPTFFLILAVIAFLEPSIWYIMAIIGLTGWMGVARLVRAEVLSLRERDFILAARALGASDARIIFRHILPNALSPVLVSATLGVAGAILTESALSFLGIGVQPPTPSWGNILTSGKDYIEFGWWLSLFPGLAILVTVLAYNLLGEGIRDALDPRLNR
ncbi:binding-protein-dependent transport systems inner membrane component [Geobacter metallireducens RCH3]|uniref:Peptide ABC transporter, membrane protein n=1 Tax=Geobacter metallireducens (strain ATCC 53774 / DSM 7210 / GS-15) TaxID=269799 RepID=Q39WA2_GEOMG|nr:oligopeptide ABC transporter permease [Geobacter metallireducens]ABB31472.1 peptide ABC transporter, membrane protein [Geobacter metallireducens GS-15]EHP88440.1 binding-protein-dependent transport systems inner membrane component [Geobacter metallireducens RCH3]